MNFGFGTEPDFVAVCHCLDCKRASGGEAAIFFGIPQDDFTLLSGQPKAEYYIADSRKKLDRNFYRTCGLDRPDVIQPKLEMFPKRRLKWAKPLDLSRFDGMPS